MASIGPYNPEVVHDFFIYRYFLLEISVAISDIVTFIVIGDEI